jgi:hypothetical protein
MALATRADRLRFAVPVVLFGALVCDPALAGDSLTRSGVVIDKRPVVDSAHWTITETSATWNTDGFTGKYTWSIPSSIPAGGANASLTVTSTDKSGGRYNGVISATADMTIEGTARAEALADKNGGQATASDTANFELVPGSYCETCTPSVTVFVQDGPHVTFQYKVDAPPCSVVARFSAEGAADDPNCKLGKLPVGKKVTVDQPEPGKAKNISPTAIPPETYNLILEILAEQEAERLAAALAAKFGATEAKDLIAGCFVVVQGGFEEEDPPTFDWFGNIVSRKVTISSEGKTAIFNACARLLLSPSPPAPPAGRARVAATGCHVITVPVFEKGTKVTKRRRKQARAAILEQVKPSCDDKRKGFTASLKARGKGATLSGATRKSIGAPLTRLSDTPANGRRASVRWKAVKR